MKYNYPVIHNGVYYKPGDEVPDNKPEEPKVMGETEKPSPAPKAKRGKDGKEGK